MCMCVCVCVCVIINFFERTMYNSIHFPPKAYTSRLTTGGKASPFVGFVGAVYEIDKLSPLVMLEVLIRAQVLGGQGDNSQLVSTKLL